MMLDFCESLYMYVWLIEIMKGTLRRYVLHQYTFLRTVHHTKRTMMSYLILINLVFFKDRYVNANQWSDSHVLL